MFVMASQDWCQESRNFKSRVLSPIDAKQQQMDLKWCCEFWRQNHVILS